MGDSSSFVYPNEMVSILQKQWDEFQKDYVSKCYPPDCKIPAPPYPDKKSLKYILDTIYHVSLLTEEGRSIALRIAYLTPSSLDSKYSEFNNLDVVPYKFSSTYPFNVSETLKLAPSIDPDQSLLLICKKSDVTATRDHSLVIWGILHLGLDWWRVVTGRAKGALCPPNCLTVSTFGPGNLTASTLGSVLFRLDQGKTISITIKSIGDGQIGEFFKSAAKEFYDHVTKKFSKKTLQKHIRLADYPSKQYFQSLRNIVSLAAEKRHGATFIIMPDEIKLDDSRLTDRIKLKYVLENVSIWNMLAREAIATYKFFECGKKREVPLLRDNQAEPNELKEYIKWDNRKKRYEKSITEYEYFISTLSGVDGAVLMNTKLEVLGYGGEIIASSPSLKKVKLALDSEAKELKDQDINIFGTRHRSAFRLCSSFENCVVFVISQDGAVKAVKRVGSDVVIWPNINISELGL